MEFLRHLLAFIDRTIINSRIILLTTTYAASHPNYLRLVEDFGHLVTTRIVPAVNRNRLLAAALGTNYERQWRDAERLRRGLKEIGIDNVDFILLSFGVRWATAARSEAKTVWW